MRKEARIDFPFQNIIQILKKELFIIIIIISFKLNDINNYIKQNFELNVA